MISRRWKLSLCYYHFILNLILPKFFSFKKMFVFYKYFLIYCFINYSIWLKIQDLLYEISLQGLYGACKHRCDSNLVQKLVYYLEYFLFLIASYILCLTPEPKERFWYFQQVLILCPNLSLPKNLIVIKRTCTGILLVEYLKRVLFIFYY